ncbi:MAG TPA: molybdopterin converting factor subunit 1 [Thermomicrobiales bacterium]|jgi:molybdopterin synthase catalytic subunit|nr:molybdopterin converting factor subunit 1 [Thermomicrobiales bacterium]
MKITLRYFALWREELGRDEETREVAPGTTAGALADVVAAERPRLVGLRRATLLMVNQEYVPASTPLQDGDEVAVIPPVSGGSGAEEMPGERRWLFKVVTTPLDLNEVVAAVADPACGAIVSFTGTVRDHSLGKAVTALDYEAYPAAAEKMMAQIGAEIADRWGITRVAVIHRTGHLTAGEASVVMAVAAPHRQGAFEACAYLIDRLKQIVPIWKKEAYSDGAVWVGSEADYPRGQ